MLLIRHCLSPARTRLRRQSADLAYVGSAWAEAWKRDGVLDGLKSCVACPAAIGSCAYVAWAVNERNGRARRPEGEQQGNVDGRRNTKGCQDTEYQKEKELRGQLRLLPASLICNYSLARLCASANCRAPRDPFRGDLGRIFFFFSFFTSCPCLCTEFQLPISFPTREGHRSITSMGTWLVGSGPPLLGCPLLFSLSFFPVAKLGLQLHSIFPFFLYPCSAVSYVGPKGTAPVTRRRG